MDALPPRSGAQPAPTSAELAKATHRERFTTLTAPVSGTVQQLAIHPAGGVVTEAQPLIVIVPEEANAEVVADAVQDEKRGAIFPARLVLRVSRIDADGQQIRLGPGMNVQAEITTGTRRVIEFLPSPIQKAGQET